MSIKFNKLLVQAWSDELSDKEPHEYPFLANYNKNKKSLTYVATLHSTQADSETFNLIKETIENNSLDIVIVEGIPNSSGESPKSIYNWAMSQGKDGTYSGFETAFTIKTSASKNIPFIGGEPKEQYIVNELLEKDYKATDYLFYTFTQQLFQAKEANLIEKLSIEDEFIDHISHVKSEINLNDSFNLSDYYNWFITNNFNEFNISDLSPEICAPYQDGKLLTQQISSAICILRDQFTVSVIEEALIKYNNVMIVYGGSHWSTQSESLRAALGHPSFSKF